MSFVAGFVLSVTLLCVRGEAPVAAQAEGRVEPASQVTWGINVALAPTWFDPAESTGLLTAFIFYYALHDALVKPMPGKPMAPSLAESWSVSADGLTYEFVLRQGVRFHNGDPVTADDVKFSFERYRGLSAKALKDRVNKVHVVDAHRVRFQLKEPWPDFLAFYATPATGAATRASRRRRSGPGPTGSCPLRRAWRSCWKPTRSTGARARASSASC
jgi:peptide/nickel transport system substrate-binding protein